MTLTIAFSLVTHFTFNPVKSPESTALCTKSRFESFKKRIIIPCSIKGSSSKSGASESYPSPGIRVGLILTRGKPLGRPFSLVLDKLSLSFLGFSPVDCSSWGRFKAIEESGVDETGVLDGALILSFGSFGCSGECDSGGGGWGEFDALDDGIFNFNLRAMIGFYKGVTFY